MITIDDDRLSESPFVERIWRAHSEGASRPFLSIAESRSEMVVTRYHGKLTLSVRGPETKAMPLGDCPADYEWLGILLKPGAFLYSLPARSLTNADVTLPEAMSNSFWLAGSAWEFPTYDNAEIFVNRLVRAGLLAHDPLIEDALQGQIKGLTSRSLQYHFLQATGIAQNLARQIERARYATLLLQQGVSISETILKAGYSDQPYLTRSLQRFIGQSPAELLHHSRPEQLSYLYKTTPYP